MKTFVLVIFFLMTSQVVAAQWVKQAVDTTAAFRGLSVVSEKVVWASGTGGTVIRTVDGGKTWGVIAVAGAEKLDFRDIEAFDANTAYILSIGNGADSRIYKTTDGGKTWKEQFRNANEKAFFDAIACWDAKNCIAMSDPVDGHYVLINTTDGETWKPIVSNQLPAAKDGEAAFAASGTCLYINPSNGDVFLVSGGNDARVFKSTDRGSSWTAATAPIVKGKPGSGIFSITFRNELHGTVVGGNYEKPAEAANAVAFSRDGGKTWYEGEGVSGYRSGVTYIDDRSVIAVGTNGTDISTDRGGKWTKIGDQNLNAVAAKGKKAVWAVGPKGTVVRLGGTVASLQAVIGDPLNVNAVQLSHSVIRKDCPTDQKDCSAGSLVSVAVTAVVFGADEGEFNYTVSAGRVIGQGANVKWDLSDVGPGTYTITVGIKIRLWGVAGSTKTETITIR